MKAVSGNGHRLVARFGYVRRVGPYTLRGGMKDADP